MQGRHEDSEDEEGPLTEGEYEEGLDDDYDDDEEEEYEEEADLLDDEEEPSGEEYIRGLEPLASTTAASPASKGQPTSEEVKPWRGLESLPDATREKYVKLLGQLRSQKKQELTLLVLGKYFTGKSLTVNALLNEDATSRAYLQRDQPPLAVFSREAHDFKLTVIDAVGLNDADAVSEKRLKVITDTIQGRKIDVILYIDRFDLYRVEGPDIQLFRALSKALGASLWENAILGLTYAGETVNGYDWEEFRKKRGERLQQAVRRYGQCPAAELPVAFIENASSCAKNEEGEQILPDKSAWIPGLMQKVADIATTRPAFEFDAAAVEKAANPNRKLRWLIPVVFAAQVAFKVLIFDRLIQDDYATGDKHGPYDAGLVKAKRAQQEMEREVAKRRTQRKSVQRAVTYYDSDSD